MNIKNNKITISSKDVDTFKTIFCNENSLIKTILKENFLAYFDNKVLDVGGGTADILSEVIPNLEVIHLDVLDFSDKPIPKKHSRVIGDFLDLNLLKNLIPINVLFMSHVQQFIDSDIDNLKLAIKKVDAKTIVIVEDLNDDFLGEVMRFSLENIRNANPEIHIPEFPYGYKKIDSKKFTADLVASNFYDLAKQCLYLMDSEVSEENLIKMQDFIQKKLTEPRFTINQEIAIYQK